MAIPVAVDDNVRAVLKGKWNGVVETNNVFYFTVTSTSTTPSTQHTLQNIGRGFWNAVKAALLVISSQKQVYSEILVESLDDDANLVNSESYFIPTGTGLGGDGGDSLPPADAWTFKYVRPSGLYRHGFKRFPGVPETDNVNGLPSSGSVSSLDALAAILGGNFTFWYDDAGDDTNADGQFTPALVQKVLNGDVVSPANFYRPAAVVFDKIGHQDTRDIGRGV